MLIVLHAVRQGGSLQFLLLLGLEAVVSVLKFKQKGHPQQGDSACPLLRSICDLTGGNSGWNHGNNNGGSLHAQQLVLYIPEDRKSNMNAIKQCACQHIQKSMSSQKVLSLDLGDLEFLSEQVATTSGTAATTTVVALLPAALPLLVRSDTLHASTIVPCMHNDSVYIQL